MNRKTPDNNQKDTLKGVRIQTLSLWMVAGTILVSILIGGGIINVMHKYRSLARMTNEYILAQNDVLNMSLGSDYLTEQARLYVITKDKSHAEAYFTESEVTQRRDNALKEMTKHLSGNDEESLQLLAEALELSNKLMELEIHSMKLAASSVNENISGLSPALQDYRLTEDEQRLSPEEKSDAACQLVFGSEYRKAKEDVEEKLSSVTQSVISICSQRQDANEADMKHSLARQCIYTFLIVLLVILAYVMIIVLILRPIRIYIKCIENNDTLEITGAYEFKYLAITYNNIYEMAAAKNDMLRRKAEIDALTGLNNRASFEQMKVKLAEVSQPFALLLIDIDVFKSINDTYGHETGDQALIRTAYLLKENFRSTDHVYRIGGDEFAVIMTNTPTNKNDIIIDKIDKINWAMQHPHDDFPKYSISVGISFSSGGYQDELFRQADKALYQTKADGRCGYTFFTS